MATQLEIKVEKYILENGGKIDIAPDGEYFVRFRSGTPIKAKGMTVMVTFNNRAVVGRTLEMALISLKKVGVLDVHQFGYDDCHKCHGTGNMGSNVDGGTCWSCNGFGIIKRK